MFLTDFCKNPNPTQKLDGLPSLIKLQYSYSRLYAYFLIGIDIIEIETVIGVHLTRIIYLYLYIFCTVSHGGSVIPNIFAIYKSQYKI